MILYHNRHQKEFVAAIKTNRLVALRAEDKEEGRFVRIDSLTWAGQPISAAQINLIDFLKSEHLK